MSEQIYTLPNDAFAKAVDASGVPMGGIGSERFHAIGSLAAAFTKAFPEAKRTIRGGYNVRGEGAEARVREWFAAQGKPLA